MHKLFFVSLATGKYDQLILVVRTATQPRMSFRHLAGYALTWPRSDQQRKSHGKTSMQAFPAHTVEGNPIPSVAFTLSHVLVYMFCGATMVPRSHKPVCSSNRSAIRRELPVSSFPSSMSQRSDLLFVPARNYCNPLIHNRRMSETYPYFLPGSRNNSDDIVDGLNVTSPGVVSSVPHFAPMRMFMLGTTSHIFGIF